MMTRNELNKLDIIAVEVWIGPLQSLIQLYFIA